MANNKKPKIGISSCLLGKNVRYDGGNTYHQNSVNQFNEIFELIHYCPEFEMGLGIPRETIQLVQELGEVYLMPSSRQGPLNDLANKTFEKYSNSDLSGYVLQSRSPSCGLGTTKLYARDEGLNEELINSNSDGLFTKFLKKQFPEMPMIDSSDLDDPILLKQFIKSVFKYDSLK